MWPYVRSLRLDCNFPRLVYERRVYRKPPGGYDDIYAPLTAKLSSMPKLRTLIISHAQKGGIPWEAISAVVRTPQLRNLRIVGCLDDRRSLPAQTERSLHLPITSELATIDYPASGYHRVSATEIKLFSVLLRQVTTQRSLEALSVPSECAPLDCLSTTEFPRLRELSLIGRRQVITSHAGGERDTPYISILANMPRLRKLSLNLAQPVGLPRQKIWPAAMPEAEFPCPDLQDLLVSYPHPDDEFYSRLPSTVQCLALRCWPRHWHSFNFLEQDGDVMAKLGWYSPALASSEILRILHRCPCPSSVRRLELEFVEDDRAGDLFRCIPGAFPQLRHLVIHRYRGSGTNVVPVAGIAQALAPLQHLRVLFCYLDFEDTPHPSVHDYSSFGPTLQRAADEFGSALSPTVEVVGLLLRQRYWNKYVCFRVVHDGHGGVRAVLEWCTAAIGEIEGTELSVDDGITPYREGMVSVFIR